MIKVGLSGNRYSGKTSVGKLFRQIGIPVFDADVVLKFIISRDLETISQIKSKVGEHIFKNGELSSKYITDSEFDKILECASFQIMKAYENFNQKNSFSVYTIFNSSFLFETDWADEMDFNINVFCPKIHRMERCKELTNMKVSDIAFMLRNEMDDLDKNKMSTYIVHNYSNMDTPTQVNKIDQKIIDTYLKNEQTHKLTPDGKGIILSHY